jgi:hypothetical protein
MSQSGIIFGAIALAFFVYITRKGELPVYAGLLLLSPSSQGSTSTQTNTANANAIVQGAFAAAGFGL